MAATSSHDAEEAMRPYLGRLHDALERAVDGQHQASADVADVVAAQAAALDAALDLLGVQG